MTEWRGYVELGERERGHAGGVGDETNGPGQARDVGRSRSGRSEGSGGAAARGMRWKARPRVGGAQGK